MAPQPEEIKLPESIHGEISGLSDEMDAYYATIRRLSMDIQEINSRMWGLIHDSMPEIREMADAGRIKINKKAMTVSPF